MRVALIFLLAALTWAQVPSPATEDAPRANLPAQRIGVDDLVAVSVYRSPELTRTVRVGADGNIRLPLLDQPVPARGLLPRELEQALARALRDAGILVDPVVTVTVAEYASRPISVMGAVNKPLTFQAVGRVTLLDALARAEGLAPNAAQEILVTVATGDCPQQPDPLRTTEKAAGDCPQQPGSSLPLRIPVRQLIDEADPALNLTLSGGEEIRVPEAGRVFVVGNVKRPGSYPVPDPRDATLLKVLAMAEGLAPFATSRAYIYRDHRQIEIQLAQVMDRKAPDVPLEPNDVLYIPDNSARRTTVTILDRAAAFATGTVSGLLIWHNR